MDRYGPGIAGEAPPPARGARAEPVYSKEISHLPYEATHYDGARKWPYTDMNAERDWPCEYPSMDCNHKAAAVRRSGLGCNAATLLSLVALAAMHAAVATPWWQP